MKNNDETMRKISGRYEDSGEENSLNLAAEKDTIERISNRCVALCATALALTIALFYFSDLDLVISDKFYDFDMRSWLLNDDGGAIKFILYDGFKYAFIGAGALIFCAFCIALIKFKNNEIFKAYKKGILILLLSMSLNASAVGILKNTTNVPCPVQIRHFGGVYPYVKIFDRYPADFVQARKAKCWPAGHASMGFSLMALYFLFKRKCNKIIALAAAIIIGWATGGYKMLIGDHFLSHTLITMLLSWLIILIIAKFVLLSPFSLPRHFNKRLRQAT